jgi:hypothetical protein
MFSSKTWAKEQRKYQTFGRSQQGILSCRPRRGRISIFKQAFGSEGTIENSPAFQWGQVGKTPSPAGTAEKKRLFKRPSGTCCDTVKPRRSNAELLSKCPFGTQRIGLSKIEVRP